MNNKRRDRLHLAYLAAVFMLGALTCWAGVNQRTETFRNQFFIVSEANLKRHELILQMPTQITKVMSVTNKATYTDEAGQREPLNKIRAGDTVFVDYEKTPKGFVALSLRGGPMTVELLHKLYLKG